MTKKALKALREKLNLSYKQTWLALTVLAALLTVLVSIVYNIDLIKIQGGEPPVDRTINYYGLYKTNAIKLIRKSEQHSGDIMCTNVYYEIDGLKSLETQEAINRSIANYASSKIDETHCIELTPHANLYNVLSFETVITDAVNASDEYGGLSYNLNNGELLSFDDVLAEGADRKGLFRDAYIDFLAEQANSQKAASEEQSIDTEKCNCSRNDEKNTLKTDEPSVVKDNPEALEQANAFADKYASVGDLPFYLTNDSIVVAIKDNDSMNQRYRISGSDAIGSFAFLADYRTEESIFTDDSISMNGLYLSGRNNDLLAEKTTYETEKGLIDVEYAYYESKSHNESHSIQSYLENRYLNEEGDFIIVQANVRFTNLIANRTPRLAYFDKIIVCSTTRDDYESSQKYLISEQKAAHSGFYNSTIDESPESESMNCRDESYARPVVVVAKNGNVYDDASDFLKKDELKKFIQNDPTYSQKSTDIAADYDYIISDQGLVIIPNASLIQRNHIDDVDFENYILKYDWPHLDTSIFSVNLFE